MYKRVAPLPHGSNLTPMVTCWEVIVFPALTAGKTTLKISSPRKVTPSYGYESFADWFSVVETVLVWVWGLSLNEMRTLSASWMSV